MARNLCSGEWIGEDRLLHYVGEPAFDCFITNPEGWVCPKCGAVWAPSVRECEHCKPLTFVEVNIGGIGCHTEREVE